MSKKIDYSKYKCPYSHLEKECGHELHSPKGYQDVYSVWCNCGYRSPVFYLDPDVLGLELKVDEDEFLECDITESDFCSCEGVQDLHAMTGQCRKCGKECDY